VALVWAALVWGFAEATVFFVVPDVLLTYAALSDWRAALDATAAALAGALAGGAVMYAWGRRDAAAAVAAIQRVPGMTAARIELVDRAIRERRWGSFVAGAFAGVPYKTYAVKSGSLGVGAAWFFILSVFARSLRFVTLVLVTALISSTWLTHWTLAHKRLALVIVWLIVYAVYFRAALFGSRRRYTPPHRGQP
jgi:membrane protein YqaA with SNARE-associated domain